MTNPKRFLIRNQADLEWMWRELMGPLGFSSGSLWLVLVQPDGEAVPQITHIEGCDGPCEPDYALRFAEFLDHITRDAAEGTRWAVLRSRPGRGGIDDGDRQWAAAIYSAGRRVGAPLEVIHLATDADVVPLPIDEVADHLRAS